MAGEQSCVCDQSTLQGAALKRCGLLTMQCAAEREKCSPDSWSHQDEQGC